MFILMIGSTDSQATAETIVNLASASLSRGHRVTVFFNAESTRLLETKTGAEGLSGLISRGVRLLACRTSAQELGLTPRDIVEGAEMSSMGELVDLVEASDRSLFLG
jgi:predicted peroxiredoxin